MTDRLLKAKSSPPEPRGSGGLNALTYPSIGVINHVEMKPNQTPLRCHFPVKQQAMEAFF